MWVEARLTFSHEQCIREAPNYHQNKKIESNFFEGFLIRFLQKKLIDFLLHLFCICLEFFKKWICLQRLFPKKSELFPDFCLQILVFLAPADL